MLSGDEITGSIHEYAENQKNIGKLTGLLEGLAIGSILTSMYFLYRLGA